MPLIDQIRVGLMWILRAGVVFRLIIIAIKLNNEDEEQAMKKRLKYLFGFYIIAESTGYVVSLIRMYYGNTPDNVQISLLLNFIKEVV